MRISRDQIICGIPAMQLRDAFKRLDSAFDVEHLADLLKVGPAEAQACLDSLMVEGYVERDFEAEGRQFFRATVRGGALALASALKPISRERADTLVAGVVERAQQVNADTDQLYRVSKLLVFGSYLTETDELGDVDIAVELTRKDDEWPPMPEGEYEYARRCGKRPRGALEALALPQETVWRLLKGGSRHISIHPTSDPVLRSANTRPLL